MPHAHRPPREETSSPLIDEPGHLPVEPDLGPAMPPVSPPEPDADPAAVDTPR